MRTTRFFTLLALYSLAFTGLNTQTFAADDTRCERQCIEAIVNDYVQALVAHDPNTIAADSTLRVTENGQVTPLGEGIWQSITQRESYSQVFVDDGLQDAVFFGAFREQDNPLLLALRFKLNDQRIVEVESLVSRPDERNRLISRHELTEANPAFEIELPTEQRQTREQLIAAGHAYFDGLQYNTDEGVPMHRECLRRENGVVLLRNRNPETEACPTGFARFSYITDIRDRSVAIVDEARGLVLMWAFFDVPGNIAVTGQGGPSDVGGANASDTRRMPRSLYIAELFRWVDGGIKDIDAVMFNLDLGATSGW